MIRKYLEHNPFPIDRRWDEADKPVLILGGEFHSIPSLNTRLTGTAAYIVGLNDKFAEAVPKLVTTEYMQFYEMRVCDLSFLETQTKLKHLSIRWNTKVVDLSPLANLTGIETLILEDTPKAHDLTPISRLGKLIDFKFSGGIWNKNTAQSLVPIAQCKALKYLILGNLKVLDGGLRPLAGCRSLEKLLLSNQFPTEDYAYLSVHLPNTECAEFSPYVRLERPIDGKDIMITGKRKPFLNSQMDKRKIEKYVAKFRQLQQEFGS